MATKPLPDYTTPEAFLFSTPPYDVLKVTETNVEELLVKSLRLDGYCPYCQQPRTFNRSSAAQGSHWFTNYDNDDGHLYGEPPPSKFTDELIQNSRIFRDVTMRMAVGGTCDVLVTKLLPGGTFNFATFLIVGAVYTVKSEDVQLAVLNRCEPGPGGEFKVFIFALNDGRFAFAVPRTLEEQFLGFNWPDGFKNFTFEVDETIKLLPHPINTYMHFLEDYVFLHAKALDYLALSYANSHLGKHFLAHRLDDATQQLYEQREREASYFGISTPSTFLIRSGPLIYFALSFDLWRRVRRLPAGRLYSDKYWFAFETRDLLGRVYSFLYALAPLGFGAMIYVLFAISQGLGLSVFGRVVTIPGLLTLKFPAALGPGWVQADYFAMAIAWVLVPLHFFILLITVRKLVGVVNANMRQT